MKAWTSFSASDWAKAGWSLETFFEMVKGGFAQVFFMVIKGQVRIKPNSQIIDCGGEGCDLTIEAEMSYEG